METPCNVFYYLIKLQDPKISLSKLKIFHLLRRHSNFEPKFCFFFLKLGSHFVQQSTVAKQRGVVAPIGVARQLNKLFIVNIVSSLISRLLPLWKPVCETGFFFSLYSKIKAGFFSSGL